MNALHGDALNILQTIPSDTEPNYNNLVLRLDMRYGNARLQQVYHAQLKNRCQEKGQTLQEFQAEIERFNMAHPCAPNTVLEQLAVKSFKVGVIDVALQQNLRLSHPKTLDEMLAQALEFEAVKQN